VVTCRRRSAIHPPGDESFGVENELRKEEADYSQDAGPPKKSSIAGLVDERPVAMTTVVMKSFERLVMTRL